MLDILKKKFKYNEKILNNHTFINNFNNFINDIDSDYVSCLLDKIDLNKLGEEGFVKSNHFDYIVSFSLKRKYGKEFKNVIISVVDDYSNEIKLSIMEIGSLVILKRVFCDYIHDDVLFINITWNNKGHMYSFYSKDRGSSKMKKIYKKNNKMKTMIKD